MWISVNDDNLAFGCDLPVLNGSEWGFLKIHALTTCLCGCGLFLPLGAHQSPNLASQLLWGVSLPARTIGGPPLLPNFFYGSWEL